MVSAGGAAVAKKAPATKKAKPSSHPPYYEMTKEALLALKERTGSSHYAIAKHIEEQQKVTLPPNFKKLLSVQLKKLVASGKLTKVKNSFKLGAAPKKPSEDSKPKPKPKPAVKVTKIAAKKEKSAPVKAKSKTVSKPKVAAKPVKKVAKSSAKSPAKKVAAAKVKKAAPKRPKSIKSPAKKAAAKSIKSPAKKATMSKRVRK